MPSARRIGYIQARNADLEKSRIEALKQNQINTKALADQATQRQNQLNKNRAYDLSLRNEKRAQAEFDAEKQEGIIKSGVDALWAFSQTNPTGKIRDEAKRRGIPPESVDRFISAIGQKKFETDEAKRKQPPKPDKSQAKINSLTDKILTEEFKETDKQNKLRLKEWYRRRDNLNAGRTPQRSVSGSNVAPVQSSIPAQTTQGVQPAPRSVSQPVSQATPSSQTDFETRSDILRSKFNQAKTRGDKKAMRELDDTYRTLLNAEERKGRTSNEDLLKSIKRREAVSLDEVLGLTKATSNKKEKSYLMKVFTKPSRAFSEGLARLHVGDAIRYEDKATGKLLTVDEVQNRLAFEDVKPIDARGEILKAKVEAKQSTKALDEPEVLGGKEKISSIEDYPSSTSEGRDLTPSERADAVYDTTTKQLEVGEDAHTYKRKVLNHLFHNPVFQSIASWWHGHGAKSAHEIPAKRVNLGKHKNINPTNVQAQFKYEINEYNKVARGSKELGKPIHKFKMSRELSSALKRLAEGRGKVVLTPEEREKKEKDYKEFLHRLKTKGLSYE